MFAYITLFASYFAQPADKGPVHFRSRGFSPSYFVGWPTPKMKYESAQFIILDNTQDMIFKQGDYEQWIAYHVRLLDHPYWNVREESTKLLLAEPLDCITEFLPDYGSEERMARLIRIRRLYKSPPPERTEQHWFP